MCDESKNRIKELRKWLLSAFSGMDELGLTLHPFIVEEVAEMARILEIDPSVVPTELRALSRNETKTELKSEDR